MRGFLKDVLPTITPADVKSTTDFDGLAALRNQAKSQSPEAIKACIRKNEHVAITLYREGEFPLPAFSPPDILGVGAHLPEPAGLGAKLRARTLVLPAA